MTIEQAITKAISADYLSEDIRGRKAKVKMYGDLFAIQAGNFEMTVPESMFFLDPLFWQSLGKAMGWKDRIYRRTLKTHEIAKTEKDFMLVPSGEDIAADRIAGWQVEWHRLIDALAEGKTAEQFFESLT